MRVAISGSTGMIGRALRASYEADGHTVVPLVRPSTQSSSGAASGIPWDPATGQIDAAGLDGVDAVVHLAGEPIGGRRWNQAHKRRVMESRVQGTGLLAETLAGLDRPPGVLVVGSAVGFYGDGGDARLTEASDSGEGFVAEVVRAWEGAAAPATAAGVRVVVARASPVISARGGMMGRLLLPFRLGIGGRLGSGQQWMSWISVDDEVRALRWLVDHDLAGPVNLTAPNPVRNAEFTKALGRVLRRPTVLPLPAPVLKLVLGAEMAEEMALISQRVVPARLLEAGFEFVHADIETAFRAVLGR